MTIALLYLLGRMPEEDEEAYETHLLECRRCLVRAEAVEQALRFHGCYEQAKALPVAAVPNTQGPGSK